jgi:hypothetical protein
VRKSGAPLRTPPRPAHHATVGSVAPLRGACPSSARRAQRCGTASAAACTAARGAPVGAFQRAARAGRSRSRLGGAPPAAASHRATCATADATRADATRRRESGGVRRTRGAFFRRFPCRFARRRRSARASRPPVLHPRDAQPRGDAELPPRRDSAPRLRQSCGFRVSAALENASGHGRLPRSTLSLAAPSTGHTHATHTPRRGRGAQAHERERPVYEVRVAAELAASGAAHQARRSRAHEAPVPRARHGCRASPRELGFATALKRKRHACERSPPAALCPTGVTSLMHGSTEEDTTPVRLG